MKDGIIIQARTGSTRLNNKILLPFYQEKSIIEILINNIKNSYPDTPVILATTSKEQDSILEEIAENSGINIFRGEEENVLLRFIGACEEYKIERLIRVCSDNPFLQTESFRDLFNEHNKTPLDYLSYGFSDQLPVIKSHLGLYGELTTLEALKRVHSSTSNPIYREHVTNYLYTHSHFFSIKLLKLPKLLKNRTDLRFTMDTMEDFTILQRIYKEYEENTDKSILALLKIVEEHQEYKQQMKENILMNEK